MKSSPDYSEFEDPGEDITTPDLSLSNETIKALEEKGIKLPTWQPVIERPE